MMSLNLHGAVGIELGAIRELSTGAVVREIVISLPDGRDFVLNVFAIERDNLLVKG